METDLTLEKREYIYKISTPKELDMTLVRAVLDRALFDELPVLSKLPNTQRVFIGEDADARFWS